MKRSILADSFDRRLLKTHSLLVGLVTEFDYSLVPKEPTIVVFFMFFSLVAEWKKRLSIASVTVTPVSNIARFRRQFVKMEAGVMPLAYLWPLVMAIHCNLLGLPHLCTNAKSSNYFCNALVLIKLFFDGDSCFEKR